MLKVKRNDDTKRNVWQGKNIAFNVQGFVSAVALAAQKPIEKQKMP